MPTEALLLIGAGGHAKVVFDALERLGQISAIDVRDDNESLDGHLFFNRRITAPVGELAGLPQLTHVAIGNNKHRSAWCVTLQRRGKTLHVVMHPDATISPRAQIGEGSFVAARAVIAPNAALGMGCIVNHGTVVDHDCVVGACAHIAPNAILGGGVRVGDGVLVGAGAVIIPEVSIGSWAVIGAGAVVIAHVQPGETVAGVPARNIRANEELRQIHRS